AHYQGSIAKRGKEMNMDVHCPACGEPWDLPHLRRDAIYDIAINEEEARDWEKLSSRKRLASLYRNRFKAMGWEFGASILDVHHCPACPKDAKPDPQKVASKRAVTEGLGADEDGVAATMEDIGL
ncbi:MAG TPA: hypothetical protein VGR89_01590, partial [Puia sp.]|nr:hypothetical protein [Puia sp.]